MNRVITNKINYVLDNWLPPRIRDSKWFMGLVFYLVFGKKYRYYMDFKDRFCFLEEEEINIYYEILADTFMDRETDLNPGCVKFICSHIKGVKVLDAATGKGYLTKMMKKAKGGGEWILVQ